jgi:hypothetical protein
MVIAKSFPATLNVGSPSECGMVVMFLNVSLEQIDLK